MSEEAAAVTVLSAEMGMTILKKNRAMAFCSEGMETMKSTPDLVMTLFMEGPA